MQEIISKRTINSKTFDKGGGNFVTKVHAGHIHFKDEIGDWKDSNIVFSDNGTYWSMTDHNYKLYVAKDFGAAQLIRFDNKFDGADHSIIYEPHSIVWHNSLTNDTVVFRNQQNVTGVLVGNNVIRYEDAFGAGIDFEITLMRSGFKKEIVIKNKPAQLPTPPGEDYKMYVLFKYSGEGLDIFDEENNLWDAQNELSSLSGFKITEKTNPVASSFIKKAYAVDSTPVDQKRVELNVKWFVKNGFIWQAKEVPLEKLLLATFPVRLDTVTNYYASAGDGLIYSQANTTYVNARNVGSSVDYTGTTMECRIYYVSSTNISCSRSYPIFDTSAIPDDATISNASLFMYLTWNGYSGSPGWDGAATITSITRGSTSTLSTSDYALTNHGSTKLASSLTYAQRVQDTYNEYVLNASGISAISKTGYTAFAYRQDIEIDNTAPSGGGYSYHIPQHATSEDTSGTKDPYLEVEYTDSAITINVYDSISITESVTVAVTSNINVYDAPTIFETVIVDSILNRFWIGGLGGGGVWNDTAHWSYSSGGSPGAPIPTRFNDVIIDSNSGFGSGGTIFLDGAYGSAVCHNFTSNSGHSYTIEYDTSDIEIFGSATFEAGLTWSSSTWTYFMSNDINETITSNGCQLNYVLFGYVPNSEDIVKGSGSWYLQDNLTIVQSFRQYNGSFYANGFNVTAGDDFSFYAETGSVPSVFMGSGIWTTSSTGSHWIHYENDGEYVQINSGTSTIRLNSDGSGQQFYLGSSGEKTFNNIELVEAGGFEYFLESGTINNLSNTTVPQYVTFDTGETVAFENFNLNGTAGNLVDISSRAITMDSYLNSGSYISMYAGNNIKGGQSFSCDVSGSVLDRAIFQIQRVGTISGNVYVEIYSHSGTYGTSSIGNTLLATSDTRDSSLFGSSTNNVYFQFSGENAITLTSGQKYVAVLCFEGGDVSNYIRLYIDNTTPTHSGNHVYYTSGWNYTASLDTYFSVSYKSPHTLWKESGVVNSSYLDLSYSEATGGATWYAHNSIDSGNNTGWIFVEDYSTYDSISISEDVSVFAETPSGVTNVFDSLSIQEQVSINVSDPVVSVFDSITISEVILTSETIAINVFDNISITENTIFSIETKINVTENISILEYSNIKTSDISINTYETVSIQEGITIQVSVGVSILENITITDNSTLLVPDNKIFVYDNISLNEDVSLMMLLDDIIYVQENINISEYVNIFVDKFFISVFDSIVSTDYIGVSTSININVTDSVYITERVDSSLVLSVYVFDSVSISESISVSLSSSINVSENINILESTSILTSLNIYVVDNIAVVENIEKTLGVSLTVIDNVLVGEDLYLNINISFSVSENITISEQTSVIRDIVVSLFDGITITEATLFYVDTNISVFDAIISTENITFFVNPLLISVIDNITIIDSFPTPDANVLDIVNIKESIIIRIKSSTYTAKNNPNLKPVGGTKGMFKRQNGSVLKGNYSFYD